MRIIKCDWFLIIISFVFTRKAPAFHCPSKCFCPSNFIVVCNNPVRFPQKRTRYFTIVCHPLRDENGQPIAHSGIITRIPDHGLSSLKELREFSLISCPVVKLPPNGVFMGLKFLSRIEIDDSILKSIPGDSFINSYNLKSVSILNSKSMRTIDPILLAGQRQLRRLEFSGIDLTGQSIHYFIQHVQGSLRYFTLNFNKRSLDVPINTFENLNLIEIDLRNNRIKNLNFLKFCIAKKIFLTNTKISSHPIDFKPYKAIAENTEYLDLSNMNLNNIENHYLPYFKKLKTLLLRKNHLKVFSVDILDKLPAIEMIDLRDNYLTTLSETFGGTNLFNKLLNNDSYQFLIHGNRFHCNCELGWLLRYYKLSRTVACRTAGVPTVSGQSLNTINSHNLTCRPPEKTRLQLLRASHWNQDYTFQLIQQNSTYYELTEAEEVVLRCSSRSDPAPDMMWIIDRNGSTVIRKAPQSRAIHSNFIDITIKQQTLKQKRYKFECVAHNRESNQTGVMIIKNVYNDQSRTTTMNNNIVKQMENLSSISRIKSTCILVIIHVALTINCMP